MLQQTGVGARSPHIGSLLELQVKAAHMHPHLPLGKYLEHYLEAPFNHNHSSGAGTAMRVGEEGASHLLMILSHFGSRALKLWFSNVKI